MSGSSMANSTDETPSWSPRSRTRCRDMGRRNAFMTLLNWSMARCGMPRWRPASACHIDIGQIEAQKGDVDGILIKQAHNDDVTGNAGLILKIVLKVALRIDRARHRDAGERGKLPHIDVDAVLTVEQSVNLCAHRIFEGSGIEALGLRLARHDQARGIGGGRLERLPCEEDDGSLHDREQKREKGRCDQTEFH